MQTNVYVKAIVVVHAVLNNTESWLNSKTKEHVKTQADYIY